MSITSTKAAIDAALKTPKGKPAVSVAEVKTIEQAALNEASGKKMLSASEEELLAKLAAGDKFSGQSYAMSTSAKAELSSFIAKYHVPVGANVDHVVGQAEVALAKTPAKAMTKAPATTGLVAVPLSSTQVPDQGNQTREAMVDSANGLFYVRTTQNHWDGSAPTVSWAGPVSFGTQTGHDADNAKLLASFTTDTKDLLYMSESDRPFDNVLLPGAGKTGVPTVADFAKLVGADPTAPTETVSYDDWFGNLTTPQDWWDDYNKTQAVQYTALKADLSNNLTDLQIFRIGDTSKDVYIVGRNTAGDLVGVHTVAVET